MPRSSPTSEPYGQGLERDRLETWGRLERARTMGLLSRFLPPAPADLVDVVAVRARMRCRWQPADIRFSSSTPFNAM